MQTVLEVLSKATEFLQSKGVPRAKLDAEHLMAAALHCKRLDLYLQHDRPLTEVELAPLRTLIKRRSMREPLQYILGETPFANVSLTTDARALIPRPETEELFEHILDRFASTPESILDLGTGTGALICAFAKHWPNAKCYAVDQSQPALQLAQENAALNQCSHIQFIHSNWFEKVDAQFKLIVSNPPYLSQEEWENAAPEVKCNEPQSALFASNNGLSDLEAIIQNAQQHLLPNGLLALETGIHHHPQLEALAHKHHWKRWESLLDSHQRPRFFLLWNG